MACKGSKPATGHPQMTHATAATTTRGALPLSTPAAAHVTVYMAKLLGSMLLAAANIPLLKASSTSR